MAGGRVEGTRLDLGELARSYHEVRGRPRRVDVVVKGDVRPLARKEQLYSALDHARLLQV
jgi:hypothetical protein